MNMSGRWVQQIKHLEIIVQLKISEEILKDVGVAGSPQGGVCSWVFFSFFLKDLNHV